MNVFSLIFWKKIWIWCKVNWKFLLGISIPIIVSIVARKGNIAKIMKSAKEAKEEQLKIERKAHGIESEKKQEATKEYIEKIDEILKTHEENIELANKKEKKSISNISSAEEATEAIKKILGE